MALTEIMQQKVYSTRTT